MNRRKRRERAFVLFFAIFLGVGLWTQAKAAHASKDYSGYNVVLVSFDALQAAHTSCLGYSRKTTPTIDSFAKKGYLFTQAISQSSWTVPATMSWFTSLYPSQHKVVNKYSIYTEQEKIMSDLRTLSPNAKTLTEILKARGYATGAFTGDAGVSARFGFGKGFDTYVDDSKFAGMDHSIPPAITWLRENKGRKFFIFLHGYDSHGQYDPPKGYTKRFVDFKYKGSLSGGKEEQGMLREEGLEKGSIRLSNEDVRFWRALYDEKINDADQRFSQFIDELRRLKLLDKTIIIIASDHGTEFYEHQRFDHGFTLYDELIHVPLIICLPGMSRGKVITDQVRGIDIMPTLLDLLRISPDETTGRQMQGISLVPLIQGRRVSVPAFSETDYRLYTHKRSIRTSDGWKFIYTMETGTKELYNWKKDPRELKNIAARQKRIAYALEQELFQWLRSMGQDERYPEKLLENTARIKEY